MAADVQEDMRLAGGVAGEEQGPAGGIVGHGHAGIGQQRGRGDDLRGAVKQRGLLARPVGGIGIDAGGHVGDRGSLAADACRDQAGQFQLANGGPHRSFSGGHFAALPRFHHSPALGIAQFAA